MEDHLPDRRDRHQRCHIREKCHGTENSPEFHLLVQNNCQRQRRHHRQRNGSHTVENRIFQSRPEEGVILQAGKIRKPHELQGIAAVPLHKSKSKGTDNRDQRKYRKSDKVWRNKRICHQSALSVAALPAFFRFIHPFFSFPLRNRAQKKGTGLYRSVSDSLFALPLHFLLIIHRGFFLPLRSSLQCRRQWRYLHS